ncbi:hypothetical protein LIER_30874 [Lithospermum erythrorhizon]|uniref:Helitron helicase-like domain-containing protein n=1 Tax=Lithospermum erythrorhizon TaxID=34254 RepID=A0AAV3RST7_LITER
MTVFNEKRKQLEKSNDVDRSTKTTEDTIIRRKRSLHHEHVVNIRGADREHYEREDESGESDNPDLMDIRVYTKSGRSHNIQYYYGCYDPLQYVLMFPSGEPGWHSNIPRVRYSMKKWRRGTLMNITNCNSFEDMLAREYQEFTGPGIDINEDARSHQNKRRKRKTVSCREYYVYKLQDRVNDKSYILRLDAYSSSI